ncbi:MAG TPA: DUF3048 domain-containing protein [Candidatus Binatia bacterium]|nr:DUF3048 domain-containing protein [Candidatus Binatia bacterium]
MWVRLKNKLRAVKDKWHNLSKKKKILVSAITVLVVAALVVGGFLLFPSKPAPVAKKVAIAKPIIIKPVSTTVASPLTGLLVSPAEAKLTVTGIMVENSDQARPQSGLSQAGIVFEALAEGGITRFLAIFQGNQSGSIGPVRSARPYFIDWLLPFDAGYAHVGGSPTALSEITSDNVRDMNQFYFSNSYTRISSREAPHNVYTSLNSLSTLEQSQGWTTSSFTGFPRKADDPSKTPTATNINFNPSNSDMAVNYVYDPSVNSYKRSEGGTPMVDANSNQQLQPNVVIAMVVPWTDGALDSSDAYYTDYSDIGSGAVYVFQDGTVTQGTWEKASTTSQLEFNTDSGAPINLNAGQTWITVLGDSSEITYSD